MAQDLTPVVKVLELRSMIQFYTPAGKKIVDEWAAQFKLSTLANVDLH